MGKKDKGGAVIMASKNGIILITVFNLPNNLKPLALTLQKNVK